MTHCCSQGLKELRCTSSPNIMSSSSIYEAPSARPGKEAGAHHLMTTGEEGSTLLFPGGWLFGKRHSPSQGTLHVLRLSVYPHKLGESIHREICEKSVSFCVCYTTRMYRGSDSQPVSSSFNRRLVISHRADRDGAQWGPHV